MTHTDIFAGLTEIIYKLAKQGEGARQIQKWDSQNTLYFVLMGEACTRVSDQVRILTYNETFCGNCFYGNLDLVRKSLHRYVMIEKELTVEQQDFFNEIIASINDMCISLKKNGTTACKKIINTAFKNLNDGL